MNTRKFLLLATLLVLTLSMASAKSTGSIFGWGLEGGIAIGDNAGSDEDISPLARGFLQIDMTKQLITRLGISYLPIKADDAVPPYSTQTFMGDARLLFRPFQFKYAAPFLYAGVGATKDTQYDSPILLAIPFGIGFQTKVSEKVAVELSGGYTLSVSDELDRRDRADDDTNWITGKKHDGFYTVSAAVSFTNPRKPAEPKMEKKPEVDLRTMDSDGDGLSDYDEINLYKTDPYKADTDGDGLTDYEEVMVYKTDPLKVDTDGDGLSDYDEVKTYKTDPLKKDTDGDGLTDYEEIMTYKTNPLLKDTDGDGLSDYDEVMVHKTNPLVKDTDGGGMDDGAEIKVGKDPLDPTDDMLDLSKPKEILFEGIHFDTAKYAVLPETAVTLEKTYNALKANPDVKITIIGHTDHVGTYADNQILSVNRAESVKNWLVKKGIDAKRIKTIGKSEGSPIATNDTAEGRAQNRRVEIEMQK